MNRSQQRKVEISTKSKKGNKFELAGYQKWMIEMKQQTKIKRKTDFVSLKNLFLKAFI